MILGKQRIEPGLGHTAGRALLQQLYREHIGEALPEILVEDGGKPYFANGRFHFSITHTKKHVLCVLSERPVGIDGEELNRDIDLRLADKILSPMERDQYLRAQDKRRALLTFWVLKEAAAKCSGEGLRGYPCNTAFSLDDPRVQEIDGCLVAIIEKI